MFLDRRAHGGDHARQRGRVHEAAAILVVAPRLGVNAGLGRRSLAAEPRALAQDLQGGASARLVVVQ
ncbi:hypothetical protein D3C85_1390150 [compost metagenome]